MSFDKIFKGLEKSIKDDKYSKVYKAGDVLIGSNVPYGILSGIPRLDLAIGRPGLPAGKVVELYGWEMTCKSTISQHILAQAQRAGGGGLLIDTEFSYDEDRAIDLGIDTDKNFIPSEADTIEAVFRQADATIESIIESDLDKPFVIIVDSITGVSTELEQKKQYGEVSKIGEDARTIRSGLRKLMPKIARSKVCIIFVNHAVSKIAATPYAKQSQSSGGHAIKFYASLRCSFGNAGELKDINKNRIGQKINIKIEKLKKARMYETEIKEVNVLTESGVDLGNEILEAGKKTGFITALNQKTFQYKDIQFTRSDWNNVIKDNGGQQKMYEEFIQHAIANGKLLPWEESFYK